MNQLRHVASGLVSIRRNPPLRLATLAFALAILAMQPDALSDDPQAGKQRGAVTSALDGEEPHHSDSVDKANHAPVSIEVARDRAKLLHEVYLATQDVIHRRYFHGGKAAVPARVMEDVFSDVNRSVGVDAKWISVTLEPMSINHAPKTDFEKQAAKQLKSGEESVELVDEGYFRRATAVSLAGGCIQCHAGLVSRPPSKPVAGLVISIAIDRDSSPPAATND